MKTIFLLIPLFAVLSLAGCTLEQAYGTGQAWQRNQCGRIPDQAEFDRCMSSTDKTYDSYQRQRESETK